MHRLTFTLNGEPRTFILDRERVCLGRQAENDLAIPDHTVSRRHAEILKTPEGWRIADLGSRNGTAVNGEPVQESALDPGDEITLGTFALRFEEEAEESVRLEATDEGVLVAEGTIVRSVEEIQRELEPESLGPGRPLRTEDLGRLARTSRILAVLSEVARTLLEADGLEGVLEKVMDVIFQHVQAQRGVILLAEAAGGELAPRMVRQAGGGTDTIQISRSIARKAFEEGVAILCQDAQVDPRFQGGESIRFLGIRSALCVPLMVEGKVIGLIYVDTPVRVKAYDEFDLDLLSALSGYLAVGIEQARLREALESERRVRSRLERYHSPAVVDQILGKGKRGEAPSLEVREVEATVLFADLVGFTSLTEHMPPPQVANMLNDYFSVMTDVIFANGGTLDKFIGDAIMAIFGAPVLTTDHAHRAVRCALDMREALGRLNAENPDGPQLLFRIGINTGPVVAGDIGSVRRMDYTVLGAAVNAASRLESEVAKPGQIVVGEATYRQLKYAFAFHKAGKVPVKGLSQPLAVYEVKGELGVDDVLKL